MSVKSNVDLFLPISFGHPILKWFDNPVDVDFSELHVDLWFRHLLVGFVVDPLQLIYPHLIKVI